MVLPEPRAHAAVLSASLLLGICHVRPAPRIRENIAQYSLLVSVNAFVGAMIGLERSFGDVAHPSCRASAVAGYRLWRDLGYAIGAVVAGGIADVFGLQAAVLTVAVLTGASGGVVAARMFETLGRSLSTGR